MRQVRRIVNPARQKGRDEDALLISVLAAFPDRVARRRSGAELQMAAGGSAVLAPNSTVTSADLLVAVEDEVEAEFFPSEATLSVEDSVRRVYDQINDLMKTLSD